MGTANRRTSVCRLAVVAAGLLASCTSGAGPTPAPRVVGATTEDAGVAGADVMLLEDGAWSRPDEAPSPEDDAAPPPDQPAETDVAPSGAGFGEPCKGNGDCEQGWCVGDEHGAVCTAPCVDSCPAGWACRRTGDIGPDVVLLCVPEPTVVCSPCTTPSDCDEHSVCALPEGSGASNEPSPVCLLECGPDKGYCTTGFACSTVALAGGSPREVCAPVEGTGCCAAATRGLREPCSRSNEHGECAGTRVCMGATGWSGCVARAPGEEICNGGDDDCDGLVDESLGPGCLCGDGSCSGPDETELTCPCDCHTCGDGRCAPCGEGPARCPADCCPPENDGEGCGDGICASAPCGEGPESCAEDCGDPCGNGLCAAGEGWLGCEEDCPPGACGNRVCEPADLGFELCPEDCRQGCGDCICDHEQGEGWSSCPEDCGWCGDGVCSSCPALAEDAGRCPADCCVPGPERCNGLDDDCDGVTDEGFELGAPCEEPPGGACVEGVVGCDEDGEPACLDGEPQPPGHPCGEYLCTGGFVSPPGACDSEGRCVAQPRVDCGGSRCASGADCLSLCAATDECRDGYDCESGRCMPSRQECVGADECIDGDPCTEDVCDARGVCARFERRPCGGDADADGDGVGDGTDLCPEHADPAQEDLDGDGVGDACDGCVASAGGEICNHVDDDCDGVTDEAVAPPGSPEVGQSCSGGSSPCMRHEVVCAGPQATACRPVGHQPAGTRCAAAVCVEAILTLPGECDSRGQCLPAGVRPCAPYRCTGEDSCAESCRGPGDCIEGYFCDRGVCVPTIERGGPCLLEEACRGGLCVDGVCCEEACAEPCRSCAVPGVAGLCRPVVGAVDPNTCTGARTCDAGGTCRAHLGSPCHQGGDCLSGHCVEGVCCDSPCSQTCQTCVAPDQAGRCVAVRLDTDRDRCAGTAGCDRRGECKLLSGQPCGADGDCLSGYCVDRICCSSSCEEPCRRCDRPGRKGNCSPVVDDVDPGSCDGPVGCDGGARCRGADGAACSTPADCLSGHCVDGICCDRPCSDRCSSCLERNTWGKCRLLRNREHAGLCAGDRVCNAYAECVLRRGKPCDEAGECESGHCVDGYCCDAPCEGLCEACNVGGAEGTCAALPDGTDPGSECAGCELCDGAGFCRPVERGADPKEHCEQEPGCGRDGSCGGDGSCALHGPERHCGAPTCSGDTRVAPATCDGNGRCLPGGAAPCPDGFACNPADGSCREACTTSLHCAEGFFCAPPRCLPLRDPGEICARAEQCASGLCVDGVCCKELCEGACRSCALDGREGECAAVEKGRSDHRRACPAGWVCDGFGGCAALPGEPCGRHKDCLAGACADGLCCDRNCDRPCERCDLPGRVGACAPIPFGEDPDLECAGAGACNGAGACARPDGETCISRFDCLSRMCVDGVCCADECDGPCRFCTPPGSPGSCRPHPRGTDPEDDCAGRLVCDGTGGCVAPLGLNCLTGAQCISGLCVDGVCCEGPCDGACQRCNGGREPGRCVFAPAGTDPDAECSEGALCDGQGACVQPLGVHCESASDCLSGHCSGGVCCRTGCDDICESCALSTSRGLCAAVGRGQDPEDECPGDETCDGQGRCVAPAGSSCAVPEECLSGFCVGGVCCEGPCNAPCLSCNLPGLAGRCSFVPVGTDPEGRCAGDAVCGQGGRCVALVGRACNSGLAECASGFCSDGLCCDSECGGPCFSCALPGSSGQCKAAPLGTNPRDSCPAGQRCDGRGACKRPDGVSCSSSDQCLSGFCTDGVCCDSACQEACLDCRSGTALGLCSPSPRGIDPDDDCPGTMICDGAGACVQRNGAPCTAAVDCLSKHCAGGVCCASPCSDPCETCDSPGLAGLCLPLPAGTVLLSGCPPGQVCSGFGTCSTPDGGGCAADEECLSGVCAHGLCCDRRCSRPCEGCDLEGSRGRCSLVPAGDSPRAGCPSGTVCDGAVNCVRLNGVPCLIGSQCLSGLCVDEVCCDGACTEACHSCVQPGSEGLCLPIPRGKDPDNDCPGLDVCDGEGGCSAFGGEECTGDESCLSGHCADGVCCDQACEGLCRSCALAGAEGTCTPVPYGQDPDDECPGAAVCDGDERCRSGAGTPCESDLDCLEGPCVHGVCCMSPCRGPCQRCDLPGKEGRCARIEPGTDPNDACPGQAVCDSLSRCRLPGGEPCGDGEECLSGLCSDGVCCDEECRGPCRSCSLQGTAGVCTGVPVGSDPDEECPGEGVCGPSGTCLLGAGAECSDDRSCITGHCTDRVCCDRACEEVCHSCRLEASIGRCIAIASGDDPEGDCGGRRMCNGEGRCAGARGAPCTTDAGCLSGRCADGVCCDSACDGACEACNGPDELGFCVAVARGTDAASECGAEAVCDGAGACAHVTGAACNTGADCLGGLCVDGVCCDSACDGLCEACDLPEQEGRCSPVPFAADVDEECDGAQACDGEGACARPDGARCSEGGDCLGTLCVDGVCCAGACDGLCETCAGSSSPGACRPVRAGSDPEAECPGEALCDGAGRCLAPAGTPCRADLECLSEICADGHCCDVRCTAPCRACDLPGAEGVCTTVPRGEDPHADCPGERVCDGGGDCALLLGQPCFGHAQCLSMTCHDRVCCERECEGGCSSCALEGSLGRCTALPRGSSASSGACPTGAVCDGAGGCVLDQGRPCADDADCLDGRCVDGFCCDASCDGLCEACDLPGHEGSYSRVERGRDPEGECPGAQTCDGGGACVAPLGAACTASADCQSGFCSDGACCDEPCEGTCEACDLAGRIGRCSPVAAGSDPYDECAGLEVCATSGRCARPVGSHCATDSDCLEGACSDEVCCDQACDGPCELCALPSSPGRCQPLARGTDPEEECPGAEVCDGRRRCVRPLGAPCASAKQCLSAACTDGVCCEHGECGGLCRACNVDGLEGICASLPAATDPDDDCPGALVCGWNERCVGPVGEPCSEDADCLNGTCRDGVCCATDCGGACQRCNGQRPGQCEPVVLQPDADTCSGASSCDAAARCRLVVGQPCSVDAECESGQCTDGRCCEEACHSPCRRCDGDRAGHCEVVAGAEDPGTCAGTMACDASGACKPKAGQLCWTNEDCASGHCVDGVCCDTACLDSCAACDRIGDEGTCGFLPAGSDPDGDCASAQARCDGAGGCRLVLGARCASGSDCASAHCTDGVCCREPDCAGPCNTCNTQAAPGSCALVPRGSDPSGRCPGLAVCDGSGACKLPLGESCTQGGDCLSGRCVDGLCCNEACDGRCRSCRLPGSRGYCRNVPDGEDPRGDCGGAATCDGLGACSLPLGSPCERGADCRSGWCVDDVCCDTPCDGVCVRCGSDGACAASPAGSDPDSDCGTCAVCKGSFLPGLEGMESACAWVLSGDDPKRDCPAEATSTCGRSGGCNGAGACLVHGEGTVCVEESCDGTRWLPSRVCDGNGGCLESRAGDCWPFLCRSASEGCPTQCRSNADCAEDGYCTGGSCQAKGEAGARCSGGDACLSGFCSDGVCCDEACTEPCHSCAQRWREGTCAKVPADTDPDGDCGQCQACNEDGRCSFIAAGGDSRGGCAEAARETCGADGTCDGAGGCRHWAAGTECRSAHCTGTTLHAADLCDGAGRCVDGGEGPCPAGFACRSSGTKCEESCFADLSCAAGYYCDLATLKCARERGLGEACSSYEGCASGYCRDGVCCDEACWDMCMSCNQAGKLGRCSYVPANTDPDYDCWLCQACDGAGGCKDAPAGTDPHDECDRGSAKCGPDGTCSGSGDCRLSPSGTVCRQASCSNATFEPADLCDGLGACVDKGATSCGAYHCSGAACRTSCSSHPHCTGEHYCSGGRCVAKKAKAEACEDDVECKSGHCEGPSGSRICCDRDCPGPCSSCTLSDAFRGTCKPRTNDICGGGDDDCDGVTDEPGSEGCETYYQDADGDGYGGGVGQCLCGPGGSLAEKRGGDCCDNDARAWPGTTAYYSGDVNCTKDAFDFDCDGVETPEYEFGRCENISIVECRTEPGYAFVYFSVVENEEPPDCSGMAWLDWPPTDEPGDGLPTTRFMPAPCGCVAFAITDCAPGLLRCAPDFFNAEVVIQRCR